MKSICEQECHMEERTPINYKYIKLTYTKNGTIVLNGTNNESERITDSELKKYL